MSNPVVTFLENTEEVEQLVKFHEEKTGSERERRFGRYFRKLWTAEVGKKAS
jgi:hypothetical protein